MFVMFLITVVGMLAWVVLLVEACLLFGDHGLSVFCFVVAGLCTSTFVLLLRSVPAADEHSALGVTSPPAPG
jgi:hypothetical protein